MVSGQGLAWRPFADGGGGAVEGGIEGGVG
jgi:hypothetical protein